MAVSVLDRARGQRNWKPYYEAADFDQPDHAMIGLINTLASAYQIVAVTARHEAFRNGTAAQLLKHGVEIDELLMRPDNDFRSAVDVKIDLVDQFTDGKIAERCLLILDDREDVVRAFRQLGVTGLVVHKRDYAS
jgi:hypothetical protein